MKTQKGFSLMEILFVVLIVGVLTAIAVTQYQSAVDKSRFTALIPTVKSLVDSQEVYRMAQGTYANDMSLLEVKPDGAHGDEATLDNGTIIEIGIDNEYRYVKATRDNLDNNYIVYQSYSENYPNEVHCEALEGSSRAQKLCRAMGGAETSGNLTEGYVTYIIRGSGAGVPASFVREAGVGNFQSCEVYPCTLTCARPITAGYDCSGTYQADRSFSEKVCKDGLCITTSYDQNEVAVSKVLCKEDEVTGVCKEMTKKTYDGQGHLLQSDRDCVSHNSDGSCEAFLSTTKNTYDEQGHLISTELSQLYNWSTYDENGRLTSINNPWGSNSTTYAYDVNGQLVAEIRDYDNCVYDSNGRLISKTDQAGSSFSYIYDGSGRLVAKIDQVGSESSYYLYNENGKLSSIQQAGNATVTYNYDPSGRLISETDQYGHTTTYTYDTNGRLSSKTDQAGTVVSYTYDGNGQVTRETTQYGTSGVRYIDYTYDPNGRLISETNSTEGTTTYTYDGNGRLSSKTQFGSTTTYTYDPNGRLISETNGSGSTITYAYDTNGNRISATNQYGSVTTYTYDGNGRLIAEAPYGCGKLGGTTIYTYDSNGNMISFTNQRTTLESYTYDENGRLISGQNIQGTTSYTYDPNGRLSSQTDPYGNVTNYTYDGNGRLVSESQYGSNGDLKDAINYTYDGNGKLVSKTNQAGSSYDYTYNASGYIENFHASTTPTYNTYDTDGYLISSTTGNAVSSYDREGRMTSMTVYASDKTTPESTESWIYDSNGNLTTHTRQFSSTTETTTYSYSNGKLTASQSPNGATTTYSYDDDGNITSQIHKDSSGNVYSSYSYTYDNGKLTSQSSQVGSEPPKTTTYTYNGDGKVSSMTSETDGRTTTFSYNPNGYMSSKNEVGSDGSSVSTTTYEYDNNGKLTSYTAQYGSVSNTHNYSYDEHGNLISQAGSFYLDGDASVTVNQYGSVMFSAGQYGS